MATSKIKGIGGILTNGTEEIKKCNFFYVILQDNWATGLQSIGVVYHRRSETIYTWNIQGYQNQFKLTTENDNTIVSTNVYSSSPNQVAPTIVQIYALA